MEVGDRIEVKVHDSAEISPVAKEVLKLTDARERLQELPERPDPVSEALTRLLLKYTWPHKLASPTMLKRRIKDLEVFLLLRMDMVFYDIEISKGLELFVVM